MGGKDGFVWRGIWGFWVGSRFLIIVMIVQLIIRYVVENHTED